MPVSEEGTMFYSQGGIVIDDMAYFTADKSNRSLNDEMEKSRFYPFIVAFSANPPFDKKRTYQFHDTYDSTPSYVITKSGSELLIAHEYKKKRTKALFVDTGNTAWMSTTNQPGAYFFGYSYYRKEDGKTLLLGSFQNGLHALNASDGTVAWFVPRHSIGGVTPAVDQKFGIVYYQYSGGIAKIDAASGTILKEIQVEPPNKTISWNAVLINDYNGFFLATYWYGNPQWDSAVRVYDRKLRLVWSKKNLPGGKKTTLVYANGILSAGIGNSWSEKYFGNDWKKLEAWSIKDGTKVWETDLSEHGFLSIPNILYFNGNFYAETQDPPGFNSKLFRINAYRGTIEGMLNYGFPSTSCAPPIIANGMLFSGNLYADNIIVTQLANGSTADWPGVFGDGQKNHNALPYEEGVVDVEMERVSMDFWRRLLRF